MPLIYRWRIWLENTFPYWAVGPVVIAVSVAFLWLIFPVFDRLMMVVHWLDDTLGTFFPYEAVFWAVILTQVNERSGGRTARSQ
ncbi:hypothetical protein [Marinimicrobium sp. ABcell2]|uniref:hypothetical protein n=1 Tax=Marinimicrobium sp. ABcell2 TaxID=3069751 RepID=UPI0027B5EB92|nr:hypothetical protein [Marinimicrobium sp. ABcell2]MDQ2077474.1 hypothetical protein [Marinimicrobium sp. ABcell2]